MDPPYESIYSLATNFRKIAKHSETNGSNQLPWFHPWCIFFFSARSRISAEEIFSTGTIFSFDPLPVKQFRDLSTYPCRSVFSIVTFTSLEISPPSLPLKIVGDILNLRSNARLRYSNSSFRGNKRGDVRSIRRVVNASISARSLEIDSRMKNTSDSPILSLLLSASMSSNAALSFFLDRSSSIETKKIAFDRNSCPQIGFIRE